MTSPEPPGGTVSWRQLAQEVERRLAEAGVPEQGTASIEARRIVERASGHEGGEYLLGLDEPAPARGVHHLDAMVERRLTGEPLQYVVGRWGFRTLDLLVDSRVLVPRPETEVVAGLAIAELDRRRAERADPLAGAATLAATRPTGADGAERVVAAQLAPTGDRLVAVDLGTGSGAIGLSVAAERERVEVWLTDVSPGAAAVARANLAGLGRSATRVRVAEGDWFAALPAELAGTIDVVVSNPPYVATDDELPAVVRDWEPMLALLGGQDGLDHLRRLVADAPRWLAPGGALVLEMAPTQTAAVAELALAAGFDEAVVHPDLVGRDRAVVARLSP